MVLCDCFATSRLYSVHSSCNSLLRCAIKLAKGCAEGVEEGESSAVGELAVLSVCVGLSAVWSGGRNLFAVGVRLCNDCCRA